MAADLATTITNLARQKYGEEGARVVAAILQVEGGLTGNVGDNGNAFGPFQFHTRGELPGYAKARGLSVQQAGQKARTDPLDAATWALDNYLGQTLQRGLQAGVKGPRLATYVQQYAQRSEEPERAGAAYQSMYGGSQEGGSDVMPKEGERDPEEEYKREQAALDEEIKALAEQHKQAAADESQAMARYQASVEGAKAIGKTVTGPTGEKVYQPPPPPDQDAYAQAYQAKQRREDIEKQLSDLRTTRRSSLTASRSAARTQKDDQQEKALDALRDLTSLEISAGNKSYEQGLARFNAILDLAKQGTDVAYKVGQLMVQAAPRMGNRTTAKAYEALVRSYQQYIPGLNLPEGDMFPVQPFDPQAMMAPYQPPPGMVDWSQAQAGLTQMQGAYGEVPDVMRQYREQALLNAVPPEEPVQAPPDRMWAEAMLNQQATRGQASPGSSQVAPPMPARLPAAPNRGSVPAPNEGPPGWGGQAPGASQVGMPVPLPPVPITRQGPPGWEGLAPQPSTIEGDMNDLLRQRAQPPGPTPTPVPSPTAVPTPVPGTLRTRSIDDIMLDPNLSPEQRDQEIDEALRREYGQ